MATTTDSLKALAETWRSQARSAQQVGMSHKPGTPAREYQDGVALTLHECARALEGWIGGDSDA